MLRLPIFLLTVSRGLSVWSEPMKPLRTSTSDLPHSMCSRTAVGCQVRFHGSAKLAPPRMNETR